MVVSMDFVELEPAKMEIRLWKKSLRLHLVSIQIKCAHRNEQPKSNEIKTEIRYNSTVFCLYCSIFALFFLSFIKMYKYIFTILSVDAVALS